MEGDLHPLPEKLPTWLRVLVAVLVVVGLLAFVRGRDHQRGDDVGALAGTSVATQPAA